MNAPRAVETAAIVAFGALAVYAGWRLATIADASQLWLIVSAIFAGYVLADLLSGIVHWVFDTWGSVDTPVLGRHFIAPFREHHSDPASITRHDFTETNGNNCIATLPALGIACALPLTSNAYVATVSLLLSLSLGIFATNQFHKWAHMPAPGPVVRRLQRWRLILPRDHHARHHTAPYATHYCITTGWLNPLLSAIDFHRQAERVIAAITGLRTDADPGWRSTSDHDRRASRE